MNKNCKRISLLHPTPHSRRNLPSFSFSTRERNGSQCSKVPQGWFFLPFRTQLKGHVLRGASEVSFPQTPPQNPTPPSHCLSLLTSQHLPVSQIIAYSCFFTWLWLLPPLRTDGHETRDPCLVYSCIPDAQVNDCHC